MLPRIRRFFDGPGPNPWVVRIALASKGVNLETITHKLRNVDGVPENRTEAMLQKNPAGTTPYVELEDGRVLAESVAIVQYLDALYPDTPPLMGGPSEDGKAFTLMWQRRVELQIVAPFQRQYQNGEGAPYFSQYVPWINESKPSVPGLRKQVLESIDWLEDELQRRNDRVEVGMISPWIAGGDAISIADLQLFCTLDFMAHPKVNAQRLTENFNPKDNLGPALTSWFGHTEKYCKRSWKTK